LGLLNKKAFRDLFGNRSRILTVFLAMVLGTTVFGTFTFTRELINREIDGEYAAMVPASASVMVDRIDDNLLQLLERHEEISGYEVGASYELMMIRANGTTKTVRLFSSPNYGQQEINIVTPVGGSFSPEQGEVLIDSDALSVADARLGDEISIRLSDETVRQYTITGLVNDLSQHPPSVHDEVYVYVSPETLADMGLSMNRIDYLLSDNQYDRPHILDVSQTLIHLLQDSGYQVGAIHVSNTPGISMHREEYKGALFITQVFSVVAFLFGCIIMSSLLGTILSGQIKQIGVLKSIGAKASNVIHSYMSAVSLLVVCNRPANKSQVEI
jgi:ABC-type transport system, involved in lipoprotein release, permease component